MGQARCCLSATSKSADPPTFADGSLATASQQDAQPAASIIQDRYTVGKVLGYGSFGEVRKVKEKKARNGRQALHCVKIMAKRLMKKS